MNDKLLHSLACAFITCFTFASSLFVFNLCSAVPIRRQEDDDDNEGADSAVRCGHTDDGDVVEQDQCHDDDVSNVEIESSPALISYNDQVLEGNRKQLHPKNILILAVISGIVAIGMGVAKEILDASKILWTGGTSSWGDLLADFIGVVVGEIMICVLVVLRSLQNLRG
jgi:hypothetical protein